MKSNTGFPIPGWTFTCNFVAAGVFKAESKVDFPLPDCTFTCTFVAVCILQYGM